MEIRQERLGVVPQNLYEFWAGCTRPASENDLALTTVEERAEQAKVLSLFTLRSHTSAVFGEVEWQQWVVRHDGKGRNAHDARLIAAMQVHGLTHLLTFSGSDFARYPGITVLSTFQPGRTHLLGEFPISGSKTNVGYLASGPVPRGSPRISVRPFQPLLSYGRSRQWAE